MGNLYLYIYLFIYFCRESNKDALLEYECLNENDLLSSMKRNTISDNTLTIFVDNVRSLLKLVNDIVKGNRIMNNDIDCGQT